MFPLVRIHINKTIVNTTMALFHYHTSAKNVDLITRGGGGKKVMRRYLISENVYNSGRPLSSLVDSKCISQTDGQMDRWVDRMKVVNMSQSCNISAICSGGLDKTRGSNNLNKPQYQLKQNIQGIVSINVHGLLFKEHSYFQNYTYN